MEAMFDEAYAATSTSSIILTMMGAKLEKNVVRESWMIPIYVGFK